MALNVLVVDDSAVLRKMVTRVLQLSGLDLGSVWEAGNGQEGLDVLEGHSVDLALVNIHMPVMTGEEMILRVRGNPATATLPIIVVSSDCSETRIERLEEHGVRFIPKPFSPGQLRDAVREVIGVSDE